MSRFFRDNGLSLVTFGLFVLFLAGQSVAGWRAQQEDQADHGRSMESFAEYLSSGHFWQATFENWESEFLQMAGYVLLTVGLYQRGSAESKDPDKSEPVDEDPESHRNEPDAPLPVRRGGLLLTLYNHSLSLAFVLLFLSAFTGHAISGLVEYNAQQFEHGKPNVSAGEFLVSSTFWFQSFQNWQSEFLAVWAMVVLSIWLRQKGSPESKPVARPHRATGNQ